MNLKLHSYEEQLQMAKAFIKKHDDFMVVSHVNPDGDAVSSTLAVGWLLHSLNKQFMMINEGSTPDKFAYLWGKEQIINLDEARPARKYKYIIAVDCADFARIGKVSEWFESDAQLLNIDHHPTNDYYGAVQVINPDAAATAEILYDLLQAFEIQWNEQIASCIYTGILTDTGGFRYANTSSKVMQTAASLLDSGVHASRLADHLLERSTMAHILLLQRALNSLSFNSKQSIGWIVITADDMKETQASNEDLEGLVNYPRNIEGIEVGVLFKEVRQDTYKVSFRSAGQVDVARIAQNYGGGGHKRAAGCTVNNQIELLVQDVIAKLERELTHV